MNTPLCYNLKNKKKMGKLKKSVRKVIDEILGNNIYKQNDDDFPTRIIDSCVLLDGCSRILQGTCRKDAIERHINACDVKSEIRRIDK